MLGWPGTEWSDTPAPQPPVTADWQVLPGDVRHTFTHFHLVLQVYTARVGHAAAPSTGTFYPQNAFRPADLPTVMRKVFNLARDAVG